MTRQVNKFLSINLAEEILACGFNGLPELMWIIVNSTKQGEGGTIFVRMSLKE